MKNDKLSTESYKGVRDFYPEDQFVQNHIIETWKDAVEKFGYQEYGASVLEPAELYKAKSGEEIVNEQTYTFKDRGERDVTLRPEMTPTVARMVAQKRRELSFPLRWYSIPNLFRYEKPQRGRLREHWQLNVDIFGVESIDAEIEIISVASSIMRSFGVDDDNFEIRVNSRKLVNAMLHDEFGFDDVTGSKLSKLIDRKSKMSHEDFEKEVNILAGAKSASFIARISSREVKDKEIKDLLARLEGLGITNAVFDPTLMRGFDYYTGIVFEVFDKNPENKRALFGGGRYDDLLSIFGNDKVSAVGFGMGDVTIRDVLETYKLLPAFKPVSEIYFALMSESVSAYAQELAGKLRAEGAKVALDYSYKKIGDQIKTADKMKVPFVVVIGEEEVKSGAFKIKHLETGKEVAVDEQGLIDAITPKN